MTATQIPVPLPAGLESPGDEVARQLPDGGWSITNDEDVLDGLDYRDLPRVPAGAAPGCESQVESGAWVCTHHVPGWHIAAGTAVLAVWRLPDDARAEALQSLGEWVEKNYAELKLSLEQRAKRCVLVAESCDRDGDIGIAKTLRESAEGWRRMAAELRNAYNALPLPEPEVSS